jgi:hypothetical protein
MKHILAFISFLFNIATELLSLLFCIGKAQVLISVVILKLFLIFLSPLRQLS